MKISRDIPRDVYALTGVWGCSSSDVWAVGDAGATLRWNGVSWSDVGGADGSWCGVWGTASDDVWAVGEFGAVARFIGTSWISVPTGTEARLTGVCALSRGEAWIVGYNGTILRWNGAHWTSMAEGDWYFERVWGSSNNDLWIAGSQGVLHWNGQGLQKQLDGMFLGIGGTAYDDVWAVGPEGNIWHYDGTRWTPKTIADGDLRAVFCVARDDAWVAGDEGILRWNGTRWSKVLAVQSALYAVWADAANVWAVGDRGVVVRVEQS